MNDQMKTDFLRKRMIQLREKNGLTITQLAKEKRINKSILSRAEKIGGPTSFKTVKHYAKMYCEWFHLSDEQCEMFLRGEKAVIMDTSALIERHTLLDELCEEYSYVFVPSFVIDELGDIENNNPNDYGREASALLRNIHEDERIYTKVYSIPTNTKSMIVDIANAVIEDTNCSVDIITYDYKVAIQIGGCVDKESKFNLLFLDDYVATKQNLVNMKYLNELNDYYAESYEDVKIELGLPLQISNNADINLDAYLSDGSTLIISAVNNKAVSPKQRMEKIRWLVEKGADINKRDCGDEYLPPISHAIRNKDFAMFMFLYKECNADPNVGSKYPYDLGKHRYKNDGNMPLMIAAWNNQIDIVKVLCADERVSKNQQDGKNGYTALIKACYWGYKECRKILEEAGADTTILDHSGMTAQDRWKECLSLGRYKERETNDRQSMHFN
jgi:ankyrin repeat protein/transcriptional regulator with XRE-family HTH domain